MAPQKLTPEGVRKGKKRNGKPNKKPNKGKG